MANTTTRLLWWCLVVSMLIYVAIAHVVRLPGTRDAPVTLLLAILVVISVGMAVGSLLYRRNALARPIQSGDLDPSRPEGMQRAFPPFMLNLVLSEAIGIYGLVLSLLSGDPVYALAFAAAALVMLYLHRPTAPDLVPPMSGGRRGLDSEPLV